MKNAPVFVLALLALLALPVFAGADPPTKPESVETPPPGPAAAVTPGEASRPAPEATAGLRDAAHVSIPGNAPGGGTGAQDSTSGVQPEKTPGEDGEKGLVEGTLEGAQAIVVGYRTGGWLAALAALVSLFTWLCRRKELGGLLDRLPKRARILVPLALGAVSALLVGLLDPNVSAAEAATLAFLTGPAAVSLHQGLARSVFGFSSPEAKEREAAASGGSGG